MSWEPAAINGFADTLEHALPTMTPPYDGTVGLASDRDFAWQMVEDMLVMATLYETGSLIEPELLDDEVVEELRRLAVAHPDRQRVAGPAARLVQGWATSSCTSQANLGDKLRPRGRAITARQRP